MSAVKTEDDAAHLLVVDDDRRIRDLLSRFLKERGYRVSVAEDAASARIAMQTFDFDLIVLDVMMPGESGLDLARAVRAKGQVPILILSARSELDDRLEGLSIGIDDYLGKPFEPQELLFRIANILRRATAMPVSPRRTAPETVTFGPFEYHLERGELRQGEASIRLTDRERELLRALAEAPQGALSREALSEIHSGANDRTIDVHINRLRRKIEEDPGNPRYLQTVRGMGYRLFLDNGY
jgi:two-component system, OmpR family, phosphate regulon response regulator OmpR